MESRLKRPPINLDELTRTKDKPEPGALRYMGDDEGHKSNRREGGGGGMGWMQLVLSCFISLVLSVVVVFLLISPVKTDLTNLANSTNGIVTRISSDISGLDTRLTNVVNAQGTYAKTTDLASLAKSSDITTLQSGITALSTKLDTANAAISSLTDRIKALEKAQATAATTSSTTGGLTWLVGQQTSQTLVNGTAGSSVSGTLSPSLLFQQTNTTAATQNNIILTVTMYAYSFPADWSMTINSVSATEGSYPLQYGVSKSGNYLTIVLWNTISGTGGFSLTTGQTVMVSVSLNMGYTYTVATPAPSVAPTVTLYSQANYTYTN